MAVDHAKHLETAGSVLDASAIAMAPEARGVEPFRPFNLDNRLPGYDGAGRDGFNQELYVSNSEWLGMPDAESALRQSQEELRLLSRQLLDIQEKERQRIAADLHDGIGQSLSLIKMSIESVAQLILAGDDQAAVEFLQQTIHKVKDAMAELRRTTSDLRPPMLDDLGIVPTMTWLFREFESACRETKIELDTNIAESDVPMPLKATIFRILQEAINNIAKHANASSIRVRLKKNDGLLQFSVEDNGRGFEPSRLVNRRIADGGFGLVTMKERARSSGGAFEINSADGQGTRIQVAWRLEGGSVNQGDDAPTRARDTR